MSSNTFVFEKSVSLMKVLDIVTRAAKRHEHDEMIEFVHFKLSPITDAWRCALESPFSIAEVVINEKGVIRVTGPPNFILLVQLCYENSY